MPIVNYISNVGIILVVGLTVGVMEVTYHGMDILLIISLDNTKHLLKMYPFLKQMICMVS